MSNETELSRAKVTSQRPLLRATILLLLIAGSLRAESLDALVDQALSSNRELRAARLRWEAMREKPAIVGALPDPMVTYGYFFEKVQTRVGAQNQRVTLSQKFPYPGKLIDARRVASKEALILMWKYQIAIRDVILRVKLGYYDLYRVDQSARILREQRDLIESIVTSARQEFEAGKSQLQDVLKAGLELDELQSRLLTLEQQRAGVVARLNALRDLPPKSKIPTVTKLPLRPLLPERDLYPVALLYRQELRAAGVAVERDQSSLDLAKKNWIPDVTLGMDYTQVNDNVFADVPGNGQDIVLGFFSINIPIWFDKLGAEREMARKNLAASKETVNDLFRQTQADVRYSWAQAQSFQDQVALYRNSLIPQAEDTYKASQAAYTTAKTDLISLLDSERSLLATRLGLVLMQAQLGKSLAELERAVGVDLQNVPAVSKKPSHE